MRRSKEETDRIINSLFGDKKDIFQGVSVDCVLITFHEKKLKVLLNKFFLSDTWMLPGGFLKKDENSDHAANRILKNRTGLENVYMKQFYFFSDVNRTNSGEVKSIIKKYNLTDVNLKWIFNRFVSIGYFSFVKYEDIAMSYKEDDDYRWVDLDHIPQLYADHNQIINKAINTVRSHIYFLPIGEKLLPEKFTSTELRTIYEGVLGKPLDRKNFQKKMLLDHIIIKLDETKEVKSYPRPILYKFNTEKLKELENIYFA